MSETRTMTLPSALSPQNNHHSSQIDRQRVSILAVAPTLSSDTSSEAGATVYIGGNAMKMDSTTWQSTITTTSLQSSNNTHTQQSTTNFNKTINEHNHHNYHHQQQQPAHVVKIKINPELEKNTRVISTVHLSSNENNNLIINQNNYNNKFNNKSVDSNIDSCVRINVLNKVNKKEEKKIQQEEEEQVELEIQEDEEEEEKDIEESSDLQNLNRDEMIQQTVTNDTNRTCFYYGTLQNQIMSSGQCSPSDTLDSGTCSDLDCTSPSLLLLKKTTTTTTNNNSIKINKHIRSGSLTSSGADIDSDDNESSVSNDSLSSREFTKLNCINIINNNNNNDIDNNIIIDKMLEATADQLGHVTININNNNNNNNNDKDTFNSNNKRNNSDDNFCNDINDEIYNNNNNNNNTIDDKNNEIIKDKYDIIDDSLSSCNSPSQSVTSTLSKSSSTPRVRSPNPLVNGQQQQQQITSPVVKECTYEERKQEKYKIDHDNAIAEKYNNYNRDKKFLYDDDRFYKFHINEFDKNNNGDLKKSINDCEIDEYFAGYKILDNKEAIRSAKGTVRGVKNRVRAGIATFLQNPSSKNYKQKDAGKIVVYTTSMRVVRKTAIACVKMMGILGTHMVDYEERNLFTSREFQTELKDRLGSETVEVPQLFIDGQYIGDADAVERLNESGELRPMLKPYKCPGKRQVCGFCGGAGAVPCIVCNGSKKSPKWNNFMNEFVALRCMKCDEVGLIRCQYCGAGDRS